MQLTMKRILFFLFINFSLIETHAAGTTPTMRVTNFACLMDKDAIANGLCVYKAMRKKFGNFSAFGTFIRPIPKFKLEMRNYIKGSSNVFRRGPINLTHNLCDKDAPSATLIFHFMPILRPVYNQLVQKCPYKGNFTLKSFVIDNLDDNAYIPFIPTGEVRTEFKFIDVERNQIVIHINVTVYLKTLSLSLFQNV